MKGGERTIKAERRERETETETSITCALARTTLKVVAGAHVQACTFKALAGSTPQKLAHVLWKSTLLEVERETRCAREQVIKGGARNGRLWCARTPSTCE